MALPTEVIEALTRGEPIPKKKLDQAWMDPILDLIQAGIVCPTKEAWAWEIGGGLGRTLAHEAAKRGLLPEGFDAWALADQDGWTVAHEAAQYGHLPKDFSQWDLANHFGCTVAHVAVRYGRLPQDFDQWHWADKIGWTVAHVAAKYGHLPEGFNRWTLATSASYSWTVAHEAARWGHLPEDFNQWHLFDQNEQTVAEIAILYLAKKALPKKDRLDFWLAPTSEGCPVMNFALENRAITSEEHEAIQQAILKTQQAQDQARMKTLSSMVF